MFLAHLSLIIKLTVHIFIFFSRTTRPISTRYSTKHPWVIGIQVYSNEGTRLFPREDNNQIAKSIAQIKNFLQNLSVSFKQTWHKVSFGKWMFKWRATPGSNKIGAKYPWMKGILVFTSKGPRHFLKRDNYEIAKIHCWH